MLTAQDFPPEVLENFQKIYVIDTEYYERPGLPGGPVVPVALQALEIRGGEWTSMFFEESERPPNPLDPNGLYVTFNAAAEWTCFAGLDWTIPQNCIDFYIEFKNLVSGFVPPLQYRNPQFHDKWNSSLLSVVRWCGLPARSAVDKEATRNLILRRHPYSAEEKEKILLYCADDVLDTDAVCKELLPRIGCIPQAIFRGHFMRPVSAMQMAGIPIDTAAYGKLLKHRQALKSRTASELAGTEVDVYEGSTMKYHKLEALVKHFGLEEVWPRPKRKRSKKPAEGSRKQTKKLFSQEVDAFESMANSHPELIPLADVVRRMKDLRTFALRVGDDGYSRFSVFPFGAITGRCTPPTRQFLFAQAAWTRNLIAPPPGWAIAYLDYSAAEVLIAAVLSGDKNLLRDYLGVDCYTNCAIRMGFAPEGSTKESIGTLRDTMKIWLLSTLYGASPKSLQRELPGSTLSQAEDFVRRNHISYERYWQWSDLRTNIFLYETGVEATSFGWTHHLDPSEREDDFSFARARNRSRNFSMQAGCSEILRWACVFATDDHITLHACLHDAVLIGAPDAEIEGTVERMRGHMIAASRLVLDAEMKVPYPQIIRYPDRMRDPRRAQVWDQLVLRLEELEQESEEVAVA